MGQIGQFNQLLILKPFYCVQINALCKTELLVLYGSNWNSSILRKEMNNIESNYERVFEL